MLNLEGRSMTTISQTETGKKYYNVRDEKGKFFTIKK
jgi:hypothetical protein